MSDGLIRYCPCAPMRTKVRMTACVIRDGELGYAPSRDHPERSCVGCGGPPEAIAEEPARQARGWTMAMSETRDET